MKNQLRFLTVFAVIQWCSSQPVLFRVREGIPSPVFLGNLATSSDLMDAVGKTEFSFLRYTIVSNEAKVHLLFRINETSSDIFTTETLDRETLCQSSSAACNLQLDVAVQSLKSAFFRKFSVTVEVQDANDNPPRFLTSQFKLSIREGVAIGTSYSLPVASDRDSEVINKVHEYQMIPPPEPFSLEMGSSTDGTVSSVWLVVKGDVDREAAHEFNFDLIARDGGTPTHNGSVSVTITVEDKNDNRPKFGKEFYVVNVTESVSVDTTILQVSANDRDFGQNAEIVYSFHSSTDERILGHFDVGKKSGNIKVKSALDKTGGSVFSFTLVATDGGSPFLSATTNVSLTILDTVNDAPEIRVNPLFSRNNVATVLESAIVGRVVALVTVRDTDSGANGKVNCSLPRGDFLVRNLQQSEYKVIVAKQLNREVVSLYNLTITCQDEGTPPQSASSFFQIQVLDVNEFAPKFLQSKYFFSLEENNNHPMFVGRVSATDGDSGINADISYSVEANASRSFSINENSGEITILEKLDRENIPKRIFKVFATDKGLTPLTGTATIVINVGDQNDNAPVFTNVPIKFTIRENVDIGFTVGRVSATDDDLGVNGDVNYFLKDTSFTGINPFSVFKNGTITTSRKIDFEDKHSYTLEIFASDNGIVQQKSSTSVTVTIVDENDNDPRIVFPFPDNESISVPHDMDPGSEVAIVQAYDIDSGLNGKFTFSLVVVNTTDLFQIGVQNGVIFLNRKISDEDLGTHRAIISVQDRGVPQRETQALLLIDVYFNDGSRSVVKESDSNMKIVIVLVCVTASLAIAVIATLCILKYIDRTRKQSPHKVSDSRYNSSESCDSADYKSETFPPCVFQVSETGRSPKKSVTFKTEHTPTNPVSSTENRKYSELKQPRKEDSGNDLSLSPTSYHFVRPDYGKRAPPGGSEVSVVDVLEQHQALVRSMKSKGRRNYQAKDISELEPDVWSDTSRETIGSDSGHGGSDVDVNINSLKINV
ncbi:protocadherin-11 X-linked-like isoform X2 [Gigantopelta aegis]|uniref:protocadherin-11 X-linked-like isoform X2 n=1 Tax=Gigantopelta aegis TaxID=1735272 RepID=UPI001B88BDFD|nr:protocadherin-11 X-linked-like isoform X2 [Gigantopelta aegis]